jgi:hypothetical protein
MPAIIKKLRAIMVPRVQNAFIKHRNAADMKLEEILEEIYRPLSLYATG